MQSFGPKTEEGPLKLLAVVSDAEAERLAELEKTLAQEDPAATARKVRLERQRITIASRLVV
jgi:hypothetical protein